MARKLFNTDGHISNDGFCALTSEEELELLPRLELAEHLDFCDFCIDRYSEYLVADTLLVPEAEIAPTIKQRLQHRLRMLFVSKATQVTAAACLTMVIWMGWFFQGDISTSNQMFVKNASASGQSFQEMVGGWSKGLGDFVNGFKIYTRGDQIGK